MLRALIQLTQSLFFISGLLILWSAFGGEIPDAETIGIYISTIITYVQGNL